MDAATLNKHLETHLRVHTFPLGIKSLKPGEPLPDKVKIPSKHLGVKIAICQAISIARRYGWTMAFSGAGPLVPHRQGGVRLRGAQRLLHLRGAGRRDVRLVQGGGGGVRRRPSTSTTSASTPTWSPAP